MKKIKTLMIAGMMAVTLAACGGQGTAETGEQNTSVSVQLDAVAEELLEGAGFEDELNQADAATVEKLYGIANAKEAVVYISSGATAEEIGLFVFETEEEAEQAEELVQARLEEQRESFESYIPKEVQKLEHAVIRRSGCSLAVCVADGKQAEEILSKYF